MVDLRTTLPCIPLHLIESQDQAIKPRLDLRTVPMPERRALAAECERRARARVEPVQIREDLGVSYKAYSRWAKLYGFRQEDLFP